MPRICGIDICKLSVVACVLEERPTEPRQSIYDETFYEFRADVSGLQGLMALAPDIAVMEPTGVKYAKMWGTQLARMGVDVRLVGNDKLRYYALHSLQFEDKNDDYDAYALACYGFDYLNSERRFLQERDRVIVRIRQLVLRLAHLNRVQSPIINNMRQDLAWQFPEIAGRQVQRRANCVPIFYTWLAGEKKDKRYEEQYQNSAGLGLTDTVVAHAKRLCDLQREEMRIEAELSELMKDERFKPYREVFAKFGFGKRVEAMILSQIFPIESYMGEDGLPEVKMRKGRNSGKPTARHLSRRRFQKALGVAPSENSSGDKLGGGVVGGSDLCRVALWQWVFTAIEPKKRRLNNGIMDKLGEKLDHEKTQGRPVRLIRSRVSSKAGEILFKELVNKIIRAK